jgi:hypothetical protein
MLSTNCATDFNEPATAAPAPSRAAHSAHSTTMRRLPTPAVEPPFDDDSALDARLTTDAVQGTLALAFALPTGIPAVPPIPQSVQPERSRLSLVPSLTDDKALDRGLARDPISGRRRCAARDDNTDDFGPQRTPRALLPEPKPWAGRLVQAIIEVTGGARPIGQLVRWTSTEVYDAVRRRCRSAAALEPSKRAGAIVRSIHVDEPVDGIAEVCAVIQHGGRCRAIALRLEGVDGRWQCTALQVG